MPPTRSQVNIGFMNVNNAEGIVRFSNLRNELDESPSSFLWHLLLWYVTAIIYGH